MPNTWFPARGISRRLLIALLAAVLVFTTLAFVPTAPHARAATNHTFEYVLVFQNGETHSGVTNEGTGNTAFVPNVGGSNVPSTENGMGIHMSCSDTFNLGLDPTDPLYGYSSAGEQPTSGVDTAWRIADYAFRRVGTNGGRCGNQDLFRPTVSVDKSTSTLEIAAPGGSVSFDVKVTNTGTEAVTIDSLTDQVTGEATSHDITAVSDPVTATTCSVPQTINPGDDYDCAFSIGVSGQPGDVVEDTVTAAGEGSVSAIEVSDDDPASVTITGDTQEGATLTLQKTVANDHGGDLDQGSFTPMVNGQAVTWDSAVNLAAGEHTASESGATGYTASAWGGDCAADGSVTLSAGDAKVCTITNSDIAPTLTLVKKVVNDNSGQAAATDWTLTATGVGGFSGLATGDADEAQVGPFEVRAGTVYVLSEDGPAGYDASDWVCDGATPESDGFVLDLAAAAVCTITNNDIARPALDVTKTVDQPTVIARDTVEFTITVRNIGNVTLGGLSIEDVMEYDGGATDLDQCENLDTETLEPGESTQTTCEVELDATTHGDGVVNKVAVWAWPPGGSIIKVRDEVPVAIVPPDAVVGGAACVSQPIPGYGFTLDQPLMYWESQGWGPTFDPSNDTLTLRLWMNTQDPTTDAPAIEYQVPWTSDLLGQEPFASAPGAPPAGFIVHESGEGYLFWPGYDDSGWTGPENGLAGIVYPGDEWRPMHSQFALNPETAVMTTQYPASTEDCAPGGALAIEKLAGPLGTPPGDAAFVNVYNRASDETSVTWQVSVKNLTDYLLLDIDFTDLATPECEAAFDAAVQKNDGGTFMDPQEALVFTCDDEVGALVAKINVAEASATDAWGQPVPPVNDDAATQAVLASAQIGDTVWADENENGVQDNGEKGISGATVRMTLPDNSVVETTTNANGLYLFSGLAAGTYKVELILSSIPEPDDGSLKLTTAGSFTVPLIDGQSYLDADFGVAATLPVTGLQSDQIALVGLILLIAGTVAVVATRRRDDQGPDEMAA